jgi:acyl-homoserine-lactone acylase
MTRRVLVALVLAASLACTSAPPAPTVSPEVAAWQARGAGVTIVRDDWGIPHISAKTDADAVFGLMYAQAEDDFNRVETNFINGMGRLAEAEGEKEVWRDLRMKLFIDPADMKAKYESSPPWLKALMNAWADFCAREICVSNVIQLHSESTEKEANFAALSKPVAAF